VINMSHGDSQLEMGLTRIGLIAAFGKFLPDADLTGAAGWTRTSDLRIRSVFSLVSNYPRLSPSVLSCK